MSDLSDPPRGTESCLLMCAEVRSSCTLPSFILRGFIEGVGVCLGRCEVSETNNLKVERETDNRRSRD